MEEGGKTLYVTPIRRYAASVVGWEVKIISSACYSHQEIKSLFSMVDNLLDPYHPGTITKNMGGGESRISLFATQDSRCGGSGLICPMLKLFDARISWRRKNHFVADKPRSPAIETAFNTPTLALQTIFVDQTDIRHDARPATNLTVDFASS